MGESGRDELRELLKQRVGQPLSGSGRSVAPDPVNLPMIRHWVDAFDDRNPIYLDEQIARASGHHGLVAPPAMLQTWTMARPRIEGIIGRGGSAGEMTPENPLSLLADAGFVGTLATNSELEFERYLRIGDQLTSATALESISTLKGTGVGDGYFVTWVTEYRDVHGSLVGSQRFRVLKFAPGRNQVERSAGSSRRADDEPRGAALPDFVLDVTATVIVAGAIASRDFMPVHHDRDYAQAQHAPDIFMNILSTNGYVARYVSDWAGPEAALRAISIRLGVPAIPGKPLTFTGSVRDEREEAAQRVLEVAVRAANDLGDHARGTVTLTLPGAR